MLRPPTCSGCPLDSIGDSFMTAEGSGVSGVLAVAEALGEQEALDGLPLRPHAPAGAIFDRTVKRAGMDRQQLAITNICKCRPPRNLLENQPYELDAVGHCKQYMDREMERFQPKVILAMGNLPLKYLAGWTGKKRTVTNVRGFYLDGARYPGIPVISTYHPSYIGRDKPNLLGVYRLDLLRARELASAGGRFSRPGKDYLVFPPRERVERWIEECRLNPELPISYDIETTESLTGVDESEIKGLIDGSVQITRIREEYQDIPEHLLVEKVEEVEQAEQETQIVRNTRITQIQFSLRPGCAIVLPWVPPFSDLAKEILALPNAKYGFNNWSFDDPILRAHGARLGGVVHDFMWAWHHLQPDLPRGLQYATSFFIPEALPWKHTSQSDPGEYGGDDVAYLRSWGGTLFDQLQGRGIKSGYDEYVVNLNPVLVAASHRGLPIDNERRLELGGRIDEARAVVDAELQGTFPDELKPVEPRNGYANPKLAEKRRADINEGLKDHDLRWIAREFPSKDHPGEVDIRQCRLQKFLPNSPKQLLAYIKWKREKEVQAKIAGYRALTRYAGMDEAGLRRMAEKNAIWQVPKELRTDRETTSKKELERLVKKTGDGFFLKVIEHREYGKARSTYVDGFKPMADGAVHTQFTFAPATGQLSSRGPNVQNISKPPGTVIKPDWTNKQRLAWYIREMVQPKPGHVLIEGDMTAFHVLTTGFNARDANYMRLARLDMHSYVGANFLNFHHKEMLKGYPPRPERWIEMEDGELRQVLKKFKLEFSEVRNKKAKPAILGIGFGLGDKKLYDMNQESFASPKEAKQVKEIIKGLFGKVFRWQDEVRGQAHRQSYLLSPHSFIRWFFDVYHNEKDKYNGGWRMSPGKDSEAAIAFLPANNAFGVMREIMRRLDEKGLNERWGFVNTVHDSLVFHCQEELAEECIVGLKEEMERPSPFLVDREVAPGGLWCGAEIAMGRSWAEMEMVR